MIDCEYLATRSGDIQVKKWTHRQTDTHVQPACLMPPTAVGGEGINTRTQKHLLVIMTEAKDDGITKRTSKRSFQLAHA